MRRNAGIAIALAAALSSAACGSDDAPGADSAKGPIIIGDAGAQSGWLQLYDDAAHKGAELAIADINAAGGIDGRKLELKALDSESDKEANYNVAVQLVQEGAQFIMATCDYDTGVAAAQAAAAEDVPTMSSCASDAQMGKQGCGPLCFTMATTTNFTGSLMAEFAYEDLGARKAALLVDTVGTYTMSLGEYFETRWTQLAGDDSIVARQTFVNSDTSMAVQIAAIAKSDADFIWLPSFLPGQGTAIRQIRAAGLDLPIVTGESMEYGKPVLDATGDPSLSNVYGTMYGYVDQFGDQSEEAIKPIIDAYRTRYDEEPNSSKFLTGYGVIQAYAQAAEACGCTTGSELSEAIENIEGFKVGGVLDTSFSSESHSPIGRSMAIYAWQDGTTEFVIRKAPAEVVPAKL